MPSSSPRSNGEAGGGSMAHFDCLEKPLAAFFRWYGRVLARHPVPFIVFPVFLTAALSFGFLYQNDINDATFLFTPEDAPSKYERAVIHQKWPVHSNNFVAGRGVTQSREIQVIAKSRDKKNILLPEYARAVQHLNDFIIKEVTVEYNNETWDYTRLCLKWRDECHRNLQVGLVSNVWGAGENVTYPSAKLLAWRIYLGSTLGGVKPLPKPGSGGKLVEEEDGPKVNLQSAQAWMLVYQLKFQRDNDSYVSGLWERSLEKALLAYTDPFIQLTFFHSQTLTEELKRNAEELIPKFVISFTILIAFAVLNSLSLIRGKPFVDWVVSKPVLAFLGVVSAGMGVASAIGLLKWCHMPYNQIVLVMPFLAVSIGVDNMFLMVAAVRRTSREWGVERRMAESLSDVAVSITITALTDALSFGVGAITSIPAVKIFCVYTCVAIVLTFLYQLTFFLALLVIYARLEEKGRHSVFLLKTVSLAEAEDSGCMDHLFMLGSRPGSPHPRKALEGAAGAEASVMVRFFRDWFAPILMHPAVKFLVIVWLCIYLGFAVWGCTLLREGLEPINLLVRDSYAIPHYHALEEYFWDYGTQVQVVINNAPDLTDPRERQKVMGVVRAFANTEHTIGMGGVELWLRELRKFVTKDWDFPESALDDPHSFYRFVCHFIRQSTYDRWSQDISWDTPNYCSNLDNPGTIKSFRFTVGMKDFARTVSQRETTELLREVASRYPIYNITTFMPLWLFTDQYRLVLPNTVQNIAIALACMLLIALLLIPQPLCALWVAVAIASIDVGVVGYMTLWGVNLDAISMITIIMSIGFSVDFSAHISYGYVVSEEEEPAERVRMALASLGWPILQGALSTVFGVAVLASVDAYMIVTFFKTVFLVIILGALHGLVFLPVLLSIFVRGTCVHGTGSDKRKKKGIRGGAGDISRVYAVAPPPTLPRASLHPPPSPHRRTPSSASNSDIHRRHYAPQGPPLPVRGALQGGTQPHRGLIFHNPVY